MRRAGAGSTDTYWMVTGRTGSEAAAGRSSAGADGREQNETGKRVVPDFELPILAEVLRVSTDWLLGKE